MFGFVLCVVHCLFFLLSGFFYLLCLFRFVNRRCNWAMIFLFLSLHHRSHDLTIFPLLLFGFDWSLHSQFFQIFFLPFFSLLFLALHNISVQGFTILSDRKLFVIIHRYSDGLSAYNLFIVIMEILDISMLQGLFCCESIVWIEYEQVL